MTQTSPTTAPKFQVNDVILYRTASGAVVMGQILAHRVVVHLNVYTVLTPSNRNVDITEDNLRPAE